MSQEINVTRRKSIKSRMLAMVLIPSLALLIVGLVISGFLVNQGIQTYRWAKDLQAAVAPGTRVVTDLQIERWLSLVQIGGGNVPQSQLNTQRAKVNADLAEIDATASSKPALAAIVRSSGDGSTSPWNRLPSVRQLVDSGGISLLDTYTYYDELLAPITNYISAVASQAPNAQIADAQLTAAALYSATEDVARANAVSFAAAIRGGMNGDEFAEYARQVGSYQSALQSLEPRMTAAERAQYSTLVSSTAWRQLTDVQTTLSSRGPTLVGITTAAPLPVAQLDWQNDTLQVTAKMLGLFDSHFQYAAALAASDGQDTLIRALIAGVIIVLAGIAVLIIAMRMSNGVVRRLGRLRRDTLDLADQHLPRLVARLRAGEPVNLADHVPVLRHGDDEIGQVAEAFNRAQHTAVSAAVQEVKTRQGANTVFLNIAHRSQVVAHRQLSVLDLAERRQDDPQQVQFLFQLDHLATRARRNAENLIILGGRRPARQWRDAVPVRDVVRSAIAETEHFARIRITSLPPVSVAGVAVADVAHLLAELLDNATAFAPPQARTQVSGNLVGRGMVIEIEDQGLGIPPDQREALNAQLRMQPDYGVMALTSDDRLGMFVVARLATQYGIMVTLTDSIYGGTKAVVVLPTSLIETGQPGTDPIIMAPADEPVGSEVDIPSGPQWPSVDVEPAAGTDIEPITQVLMPVSDNGDGHLNGNGHVADTTADTTVDTTVDTVPEPAQHVDDGTLPPLPRRRRLAGLAPQLVRSTYAAPGAPQAGSRTAEQMRSAVTAFQRATRQARDDDNDNDDSDGGQDGA